jgi:hypothetical protein
MYRIMRLTGAWLVRRVGQCACSSKMEIGKTDDEQREEPNVESGSRC